MDPAKMKVVDLRSELGALGLDTKGNKPALVERLKKALEERSGTEISDSTILDTSTEDVEETPRKPAPRTRRSSSSKVEATPRKQSRLAERESIEEERESLDSDQQESSQGHEEEEEVQCVDDRNKPSPIAVEDDGGDQTNPAQDQPAPIDPRPAREADDEDDQPLQRPSEPQPQQEGGPENTDQPTEVKKEPEDEERKERPLTEEEEWEQLNERLRIREEERKERERLQAEEDARKIEEIRDNPVKLQRMRRKQEKKARWSNFYNNVAITNEILTPPSVDALKPRQPKATDKKKEEAADKKVAEPELDDNKVTLSWYDSDLHQHLEVPELSSVSPLSEGAFCHAWAGARASHGVHTGRVCYEVRHGDVQSTTEDSSVSGLRVGWSTVDSSLHLGEGETSWGFENTGRVVHNSEFKDYGQKLKEKDVIGCYLDLESSPCTISYTVNGVELGVAYEFGKEELAGRALFPHVLTRNVTYHLNMGYDRYTMNTKKKIVRRRIEVPVEQVLEEKKRREEELARIKQEIARKRKEQREKDKKEREERMKKKKEEREKRDREKAEGRGGAGEGEGGPPKEGGTDDAPKENGDQAMEQEQPPELQEPPVKVEVEGEGGQPAQEGDQPKQGPQTENTDPNAPLVEVTEDQVFSGHVLDKRIKFVIRYEVDEELDGEEAMMKPGYWLMKDAQLVPGPRRPASYADCEVIMMVGLPGAGKTHWVKNHISQNPDKRYNVLSTGALFDCMKVDCKPFKATYEGRWEAMISKCAKCVLKVLEMAQGRRRNYILDQTNVYPSAQRRKLREFDGYRRVAVVVVPGEEEYDKRKNGRDLTEGKEVPDAAILDMKANFSLPEKSSLIDEIIYTDLGEEEAKVIVEKYQKEARAAGVKRGADRDKEEHGGKRSRSDSKGRGRDERRPPREARGGDRWGSGGGGGGGSRWGDRDGGSRWGGRDSRPPPRGDRPPRGGMGGGYGGGREFGGGKEFGGRDFGRERGEFRGRDRGAHRGGGDSRFSRDNRPGGGNMGGGGGGGGGGSWQRGGAPNRNQARGPPGKDGANGAPANQGQGWGGQQGWGNWGWGNWNQQQPQGWGNWGGWGGWGGQTGAGGAGGAGAGAGGAHGAKGGTPATPQAGAANQWGQQQQQQWTAQQWYQWQQWQQQQQGWQQYQQQAQGQTAGQGQGQSQTAAVQGQTAQTTADQQALWAQYYQNYANANPGQSALTANTTEKK